MAILTARALLERLATLTSNASDEVLENVLVPSLSINDVLYISEKLRNKEVVTVEDQALIEQFVAECVIGSVAVLVVISPDTTPNTLADAIDKQLKAKEIRACKATQNKL
jgi:hypothetical protein